MIPTIIAPKKRKLLFVSPPAVIFTVERCANANAELSSIYQSSLRYREFFPKLNHSLTLK